MFRKGAHKSPFVKQGQKLLFFVPFSHTLRDVKDWTIQLGITRRHTHSYYGQEVGVRMAIPHPQYDAYVAHDNDIALFQV